MLHQVISETGWTWHYVLWKVSRANIMLMMSDRSNVKSVKKEDIVIEDSGKNLAARFKQKTNK